jgi:hypothetical protein
MGRLNEGPGFTLRVKGLFWHELAPFRVFSVFSGQNNMRWRDIALLGLWA